MTYTIIGGDGKQYGPVAEEDVRRWIAEGRLNAQSQARREGDTEFRPLGAFPEFAAALPQQGPPPPATAPRAVASSAELLARDYNLSIGDCVAGGWKLVTSHFWPVVGVSLLVMLVSCIVGQVSGLVTRPVINQMVTEHNFSVGGILILIATSVLVAPIHGVLYAGLYIYLLKLIRGQWATVGDAFSGFGPSFGQLVLLGWVQGVLVLLGLALCVIPGVYLAVAWAFAEALVIDRQMGFWEAMELSRKVVGKHWFVVFGFVIVYSLLSISGFLACCLGIFVTIPIGLAALMCAYETIFSQPQNR